MDSEGSAKELPDGTQEEPHQARQVDQGVAWPGGMVVVWSGWVKTNPDVKRGHVEFHFSTVSDIYLLEISLICKH